MEKLWGFLPCSIFLDTKTLGKLSFFSKSKRRKEIEKSLSKIQAFLDRLNKVFSWMLECWTLLLYAGLGLSNCYQWK